MRRDEEQGSSSDPEYGSRKDWSRHGLRFVRIAGKCWLGEVVDGEVGSDMLVLEEQEAC